MRARACLLLALLGCEYHPKIRAGVVACKPGEVCPSPYVCVVKEDGEGRCDLPILAGQDAAADRQEAPASKDAAADPPAVDAAVDQPAPPPDASPDVAAPMEVGPAPPDAAPDAGPDAFECPSGRGPSMIKVGSFCIDSTEVTNLQYKPFVDDPKVDLSQQAEPCKKINTSFFPSTSEGGGLNVATRADHPVVNVDWCDAWAYCKWAGKRLCGTIGGGTLQPGAATVPSVSQWSWSCTKGGLYAYPYGTDFKTGVCNVGKPDMGLNTVPVASKRLCTGGFDDIYDMVGNVEEWVDFCRKDTVEDPDNGIVCGLMGGAFTAKEMEGGTCDDFYDDPIMDHWVGRGFRCCAP